MLVVPEKRPMTIPVSIHLRPDDEASLPFLRELIGFLEAHGAKPLLPELSMLRARDFAGYVAGGREFIEDAKLVVVVGGDGTFLRAARLFASGNVPLFGINRGRLGFLTEFSQEEAFKYLGPVLEGRYTIATRALLQARHVREGRVIQTAPFLNDAVISKGAFSRPIRIQLELDNRFLNCYAGDGLIIATATGSTAYSLSAGGPILSPAIDNVYIINPICPHTLAARPMVIPSATTLKASIISPFENLLLTIDGQEAISIVGGDEVLIDGTHLKVSLIPHPERDFYEILRRKLGWGRNLNE
ncbi:MAG: NAD(+) kinase [Spirochaetes bacterium]|nr:MAG: NAD(+) kinase [Spirochaetota bacterium]